MQVLNLQRIIYLSFAFLMIGIALLFIEEPEQHYTEASADTVPLENEALPVLEEPIPEFFTLPANPSPGDFLIVGAGPFPEADIYEISFNFPGTASEHLIFADKIYQVIAIAFDTEPGDYKLFLTPRAGQDDEISYELLIEVCDKEFSYSSFTMPPSRIDGWTSEQLALDRERVFDARNTTEPYPLWLQPFISPVEGRVSSPFGAVRVINNNPPRRHNGIDIAAPEGTPIEAANDGIVRLADFLLSGGNTVIIDHGLGLSSTYMHLDEFFVQEGERVYRGAVIGTVGMTGYATGPHLHYEVNIFQRPVNPDQLISNDLMLLPPAYVINLFEKSDRL